MALIVMASAIRANTAPQPLSARADRHIDCGLGAKTTILHSVESTPFKTNHNQSLPKKATAKTSEKLVSVTAKFPKLMEEWMMSLDQFYVYDLSTEYEETISMMPYDEEWNYIPLEEYEFSLPEGTYSFIVEFEKRDPDEYFGWSHPYIYIVEDVEVKDGCVVEFKPWECNVCLTMETTNPGGEKSTFFTQKYNPDSNKWETDVTGNISNTFCLDMIYHNGIPVKTMLINTYGFNANQCENHGYINSDEFCNFYINEVSDNFLFRQIKVMQAYPKEEDGFYVTTTQCKGAHEGTYTNSDYVFDGIQTIPSPDAFLYPPHVHEWEVPQPFILDLYSYDDPNGLASSFQILTSAPSQNIWSSGPANEYNLEEKYFCYTKSLKDVWVPHEYDWGTWYYQCGTDSPYIFPLTGDGIVMVGTTHYLMVNRMNDDTFAEYFRNFPGPEEYYLSIEEAGLDFGESAPLLSFVPSVYYGYDAESDTSYMSDSFSYYYTGRMDENYEASYALASFKMRIDGKETAVGSEEIDLWFAQNSNAHGRYDFEITTDNFETDGIKGGNKAIVSLEKNIDGFTIPTTTMLRMTDKDKKVTQQFNTQDDCEIIISAGTATGNTGEEDRGFPFWVTLSEDITIKAFCQPTDNDSAEPVEIPLEPAGHSSFYPGFGVFFQGSLANTEHLTEKGWYDLTIIAEDSHGNRQTQTLTPAFKIDDILSEVTETTYVEDSTTINGNEITAPAGAMIYAANGIKTSGKDLAPGIYFVKTRTNVKKVMVRP